MANLDATIAYFKSMYVLVNRADTVKARVELQSLFPNPPHPSYPAAHSCSAMSFAVTIGEFFPEHQSELFAAAEEAGYSRMIGGIHYRMDKDAGEDIGKGVAEEVLQFVRKL